MDRESLKWLLIGMGSLAMVVVLLGGAGLFLFLFFYADDFFPADQSAYERPTESGMERRAEAETRYFAQLEEYGLLDRYTIVVSEGEWHDLLYLQGDFEAVDDHLEELFKSEDEQEHFHRYSSIANALGNIPYGADPEQMRAVLDRWLEARPQSQGARLVLGRFLVSYAWDWRGSGYGNTVSAEGSAKFRAALEEARTVLEGARKNRPDDAEPSNMLLWVAIGLGLPRETMESYYSECIGIAPHHYGARSAKLQYILPKWYGSWEDTDEFLEECRRDAERYPLLRLLQYTGYKEMNTVRPGYKNILDRAEIQQEIISMYEDVLKIWPDSLSDQGSYAYVLYYFKKYGEAVRVFEEIGDRYHTSSLWSSVIAYNRSRAGAHAAYSSELEDAGERERYMDRAVELAPYDGYPFYRRARYYAEAGRLQEAGADALAAIGVDKNYLKAHELLHYAYANQGRFDELIAICDEMIAKGVNDDVRKVLEKAKRRAEGERRPN